VGFFDPTSLVVGETLRVSRRLDPADVEALTSECREGHPRPNARPPMRWDDEGYLVVEYVALVPIDHLVRLVHALMARTGCDAVDVVGRTVRGTPWRVSS
jgi:hypothetical protein